MFDAVGHGLQASLLANLAVSCYRNTRRAGLDLARHRRRPSTSALDAMFGGERFVTALLGQLDVDTGVFRWINAGHPAAMLLRGAQVVKELAGASALPLGINALTGGADGVPGLLGGAPARRPPPAAHRRRRRGAQRATASSSAAPASPSSRRKEAGSGLATPEVMRRLQQAILRHQVGRLQDDATMLFVEWLTGAGPADGALTVLSAPGSEQEAEQRAVGRHPLDRRRRRRHAREQRLEVVGAGRARCRRAPARSRGCCA